jgi:hypothetical protein
VARTGRVLSLTRPQRMFAQDRSTVQEGFAGDVIGLTNPGAFAIGDTIYSGMASWQVVQGSTCSEVCVDSHFETMLCPCYHAGEVGHGALSGPC